jgi:hypothetical protein
MNPNFSLESAAEKIEPRLKALQLHYQDIIEKYQPVVDHAQGQLTYIEGILSGFSTVPKSQEPKSEAKVLTSEPVALTATKVKSPRKAPKTSAGKGLTFISKYVGETLTSAVEKILGDRRGKEVGIEEVVSALYGKIGSEEFKVAKDRVTKNLSKGKVAGLWERVPEKSGYYTAKAIAKSPAKSKAKS